MQAAEPTFNAPEPEREPEPAVAEQPTADAPAEAPATTEADAAAPPAAEATEAASEEREEPAPISARTLKAPATEACPAPRVAAPDDLDTSGISAEFFRDDEESLAPLVEELVEETQPRMVLSPATMARRARFRRV
ncbi:MAG TPA: hypothetical protein VHB21_01780, partial [Minicystis sp.]|nr:hypothetical protein [Minicystis sp.]